LPYDRTGNRSKAVTGSKRGSISQVDLRSEETRDGSENRALRHCEGTGTNPLESVCACRHRTPDVEFPDSTRLADSRFDGGIGGDKP
jgi:hypothetical protein